MGCHQMKKSKSNIDINELYSTINPKSARHNNKYHRQCSDISELPKEKIIPSKALQSKVILTAYELALNLNNHIDSIPIPTIDLYHTDCIHKGFREHFSFEILKEGIDQKVINNNALLIENHEHEISYDQSHTYIQSQHQDEIDPKEVDVSFRNNSNNSHVHLRSELSQRSSKYAPKNASDFNHMNLREYMNKETEKIREKSKDHIDNKSLIETKNIDELERMNINIIGNNYFVKKDETKNKKGNIEKEREMTKTSSSIISSSNQKMKASNFSSSKISNQKKNKTINIKQKKQGNGKFTYSKVNYTASVLKIDLREAIAKIQSE